MYTFPVVHFLVSHADLAYIVIIFAVFLSFDEVQSLRVSDITFHDSFISVHVRRSKTDQYRRSNVVLISEGHSCDPVKVLRKYIEPAVLLQVQINICLSLVTVKKESIT